MHSSRVNLQHRPFLTPIWLTVGAAGAAVLFALSVIWVWGTANSTTVIVIPPAEQTERAQLLARMFGGVEGTGRLDAIYVSNTAAGRLTAAPLAEKLRLPLNVFDSGDGKTVAHRAVREHGGGRVLIVAHVEILAAVLSELSGAERVPALNARDSDAVFIVTVPRIGHANLLRFNY